MERPNILCCLADDASLHFGAYGCSWVNTPAFDRVSREGLLFSRAYTPNAKCAPSRACILTGRNSWQLEEAANHWCYWPQKFVTFPETLQEHGYFVGYTAKGWAPGIPGGKDGKQRELTGPCFDGRTLDPPAAGISEIDYAANFQDFLDEKPGDSPFCFWFGCIEPHRPYEYASGVEKGDKHLSDIEEVPEIWPDTEVVRNDLLDYGFEIEHMDRHLAQMLALLEERGELGNTLVVVSSDNGMPFPGIKGQEYERSNHLPLAMMWRDRIENPGRTVEDFASFIDFAPTFLEAAGVDPAETDMQPIQGRSLSGLFDDQGSHRDHVLIGKERHDVGRPNDAGYPIRGIVKGNYLYLRNYKPDRWPAGNPETGYPNCDGSPTKTEILNARKDPEMRHFWEFSFGKRPAEELYNIDDDPYCQENLADAVELQDLKTDLREQMEGELEEQGDPRMFGKGHVFDEYLFANEDTRGYFERFMSGDMGPGRWISETDIEDPDEFE